MDSSIKLDPEKFLLGEATQPVSSLTAPQMARLIEKILQVIKPHLKYVNSLEPITKSLNCKTDSSSYYDRVTHAHVLVFPDGMTEKTCCAFISQLSYEAEGNLGNGNGVKFLTDAKVLLTRDGFLVLWEAKYEREPKNYFGNTGIREHALYSRFSKIDSDQLAGMMTHNLFREALSNFCTIADEGLKKKEARLESMKQMVRDIKGIRYRIDFNK